ncbi:hypothetical protein LTR53_005013 [Teratosphaeriaceae sp. CCFEE 6253]|nr:hypothetical protein LTR53_005013 [Teratosphaeriaceae sp. CCFEE 6253]
MHPQPAQGPEPPLDLVPQHEIKYYPDHVFAYVDRFRGVAMYKHWPQRTHGVPRDSVVSTARAGTGVAAAAGPEGQGQGSADAAADGQAQGSGELKGQGQG